MLRGLRVNTVGLLIALAVAFPLYWMVLSALKPRTALEAGDPTPFTLSPTLDSFRRVLLVEDFGRYLLNSATVAAAVVVFSTLCAFLAAVALTRYRFRSRVTLLVMVLIAQMVPVEALTIPLFFLMRGIGQTVPQLGLNHLGSLMLVHTAFAIPLAIWMLRGFVAAVPRELEEAARLDGAGSLTFVWRVLFPLVAPGVVATSIFSFIMTWNDFLFATTFIISAQEKQTLPVVLLSFFRPDQNDWGAIMAGSVLMTVPVLVFFLFVQRRLASGLGGAVKG
ncbi:N,N'-diacetylchitobiose transport system permease protein [Spinactinospora alkalitolerans]|uniref:N,N'-diacetylchitobiose transport system permease protein n=1 Tax=Spinactinospora alkalitolerans TaxID=687207 RepID=A0A852U1D1_9ACTN|nr:carbohydrate ABC transporter permease [Spinactinospora alkalitolerans]NYE47800.1 N,N'-diacetylchitobiose transport system permease protein [Spinactinospora alkalitolerans]